MAKLAKFPLRGEAGKEAGFALSVVDSTVRDPMGKALSTRFLTKLNGLEDLPVPEVGAPRTVQVFSTMAEASRWLEQLAREGGHRHQIDFGSFQTNGSLVEA